ncbi:MAG: hypothetical protein NTY03_00930 [Candidatus Bathyarchaeota archaeon]|nr:hypothetical protein [Candidatus Bathyarchaeota archaeon]
MADKIEFEGVIRFNGSSEDFQKMIREYKEKGLSLGHVKNDEKLYNSLVGTWPTPERPKFKPRPFPGGNPILELAGPDFWKKLDLKSKHIWVDQINGGITPAHYHIGDQIYLLDKAQFKEAIGKVAENIAGKLADRADFNSAIDALNQMNPGK